VKVKLLLATLLLTGCASDGTQVNKWDYYKPEHVKCKNYEIKVCRQFGAHLICECVKKRDFRAYV
jgi:hypothetical protein